MKLNIVLSTGLVLSFAAVVSAQTNDGPPKVLKIIREEIKPGRESAHEAVEKGYVRLLSKAKYAHYLALTTVTGPSEAWFLEPYPSFEALGTTRESMNNPAFKTEMDQLDSRDGEVRSGGRVWIATFRKELSYLSDEYWANRGKNHYASIAIVRVRPGRNSDFTKARQLLNEGHTAAGHTSPFVVYGVTSGAPAGTFVVMRGLRTLKDLDAEPGAKTLADALGEEKMKELGKLYSEAVLVSDNMLFAANPAMSYISDEGMAMDPDFWRPKVKAAPAPKKAPDAKGPEKAGMH